MLHVASAQKRQATWEAAASDIVMFTSGRSAVTSAVLISALAGTRRRLGSGSRLGSVARAVEQSSLVPCLCLLSRSRPADVKESRPKDISYPASVESTNRVATGRQPVDQGVPEETEAVLSVQGFLYLQRTFRKVPKY